MNKIILASSNKGKLREIQQSLIGLSLEVVLQNETDIATVAETGLTFIENAILKARHAAQITGLPAIADDSGLVVEALLGQPGIYSARFAGENASDEDNVNKLLDVMKAIPRENRQAHFYCAMVLLRYPVDPEPIIASGSWTGEILLTPHGNKGFGYDPIFYVPTHHCSAAELDIAEKNKISHRGCALNQLKKFMHADIK